VLKTLLEAIQWIFRVNDEVLFLLGGLDLVHVAAHFIHLLHFFHTFGELSAFFLVLLVFNLLALLGLKTSMRSTLGYRWHHDDWLTLAVLLGT